MLLQEALHETLDSYMRYIRKPVPIFCSFLRLLVFYASPSKAHRPYFTAVQQIELPDGTLGEIRILHGDGIIVSDPMRSIVAGIDGRLLARTPHTQAMVILCSREHRCRAFDLRRNLVFETEPATFRAGPIVPIRDDEREYLGEIERGDQSWGFRPRPASLFEIVEANFAYAPSRAFNLALTAFRGVASLIIFAGLHRPRSTKRLNRLLWTGGVMLRLTFAAIAIVIGFFFAGLFGSTNLLWLASTAAGAVAVLSLVRLSQTYRAAHRQH
jgi:hypothetical protein